jgi:serine/threonine-protein kinase
MASETELGGYSLLDRIATGGMAEVYRARALGEPAPGIEEPPEVVLKRLLPTWRVEQDYVDAFVAEGKLGVRIKHPNLVRTYKVFKKGLDYFMVQELVDGLNLAQLSEKARSRKIPLTPAAAVWAALSLLRALEGLHKLRFGEGAPTVVHCDVNPSNVLVSKSGELKLTDFGVATPEGSPAVGSGGSIRGTLAYMSPEQVLGCPVDRRSDLFAAGVVLWELLANRPLIDAPSHYEAIQRARECRVPLLSTLRNDLPELLVQIVRKAVYADASLRFQDAGEFLHALEVLARRSNLALAAESIAPEVAG